MANPLDSFKSSTPGDSDFRLEPVPQLLPLLKAYGLSIACERYDDQMRRWSKLVERAIRDTRAKQPAQIQAGNSQ